MLVVAVPLIVFVALVLIDRRSSAEKNLLCQSHGRVAAALIILRMFLAAFDILEEQIPLTAFIVYIIVGLTWLSLIVYYLPFFTQVSTVAS